MQTEVVRNEDERRYEVRADGELAGFTRYRDRPGLIAFLHTEVDERFQGRGVGSTLVRAALEDARERGLEVLPFCPFVNDYVRRHDEYRALVPERYRAKFDL